MGASVVGPGTLLRQRRAFLQLGGGLLVGAGLPGLGLASPPGGAAPARRRAKACLLLFQVGGPYQGDTFDPKPAAPEEVRGHYRRIATNVPGVFVTDALPLLSRHADKFAIVRSVHHRIRCHNPAIYCSLVGREATDPMAVSNRTAARRTDHPHYASVIARLRPDGSGLPGHVIIPDVTNNGPSRSPGLLAGYLGAAYDPFVLGRDPSEPDFRIDAVTLPADVPRGRLAERRTLLDRLDAQRRQLDTTGGLDRWNTFAQRAYALLTSPRGRQAFALHQEPERLRDRYGRTTYGQGVLLARRLIEAGVPFVSVFSHTDVDRGSWDTHQNHYQRVRTLLPEADQTFSAVLEDLHQRGMLDDVLVLWLGEFGRTPRMGVQFSNNSNNTNGRDHWCNCYSVVLAGGGVRGGQVVGSSDFMAAYPQERPVHVSDLAATVFDAFGVDPRAQLHDIQGQLRFVCDGHPIQELF
jgi:hypothetical protein